MFLRKTPTQVLSCKICEIFKNTYFEEHLRTTASKHRSSCKSCCSALINAVMKYSFSTAVVQSWTSLQANLLKIALHHRYFSKNFTTGAEQRYWKMHLDAASEDEFILETFIYGCSSKAAANIFILEILTNILHFLLWRHVKEERVFMIFF